MIIFYPTLKALLRRYQNNMSKNKNNSALINEGLDECKAESEEVIPEKCSHCNKQGVYRYAPSNIEENRRWECLEHGKKYHNDAEWDYFGDL